MADNPPNVEPPGTTTQKEKVVLALLLSAASVIILWGWFQSVHGLDVALRQEFAVAWTPPTGVFLKQGPPSFRYDGDSKQLVVMGTVDRKLKAELSELVHVEKGPALPLAQTYLKALDELAYKSNKALTGVLFQLLLLGGLSGILGVQLRSLINFVGVACFKNILDVSRWWPWYWIRLFSGFILGLLVVILIEAGFFKASDSAPSGTVWWVAVAVLAGFGADEFAQRLRSLTQTLFGEKK
jgi:hypothetical protein